MHAHQLLPQRAQTEAEQAPCGRVLLPVQEHQVLRVHPRELQFRVVIAVIKAGEDHISDHGTAVGEEDNPDQGQLRGHRSDNGEFGVVAEPAEVELRVHHVLDAQTGGVSGGAVPLHHRREQEDLGGPVRDARVPGRHHHIRHRQPGETERDQGGTVCVAATTGQCARAQSQGTAGHQGALHGGAADECAAEDQQR